MTTIEIDKKYKQHIEQINVREYEKEFKTKCLMTTRFNNNTADENKQFRERKWQNGCIYGTSVMVSKRINPNAKLFVLEMNNDMNKIIGIGLVLNKPIFNKYKIYNENSYNRYSYIGKKRIAREDMTEEEEIIMQVFDILCFSGTNHTKRGHGMTAFPTKILYRCRKRIDLVKSVENMFETRK
jgi:hypothetical protein